MKVDCIELVRIQNGRREVLTTWAPKDGIFPLKVPLDTKNNFVRALERAVEPRRAPTREH